MTVRRVATLCVTLLTFLVAGIPAALAANYPPGGSEGTGAVVGGVKAGSPSSSSGGSEVLDSGSGLAATGGDFSMLWVGAALLVAGILLVVVSRRRATR